MRKTKTTLLLLFTVLLMSYDGKAQNTEPDTLEDTFRYAIESAIEKDQKYTCKAKNFNPAYQRKVSMTWKGLFKNCDNEYVAKIDFTYDDCWKNNVNDTMNFIFNKNTNDQWVFVKLTFTSGEAFGYVPEALEEWHQKISKKRIVI